LHLKFLLIYICKLHWKLYQGLFASVLALFFSIPPEMTRTIFTPINLKKRPIISEDQYGCLHSLDDLQVDTAYALQKSYSFENVLPKALEQTPFCSPTFVSADLSGIFEADSRSRINSQQLHTQPALMHLSGIFEADPRSPSMRSNFSASLSFQSVSRNPNMVR
jgi:hypothetical protein